MNIPHLHPAALYEAYGEQKTAVGECDRVVVTVTTRDGTLVEIAVTKTGEVSMTRTTDDETELVAKYDVETALAERRARCFAVGCNGQTGS